MIVKFIEYKRKYVWVTDYDRIIRKFRKSKIIPISANEFYYSEEDLK